MKKSAFTLVELLIVVIILGILAAIVVPQFTDAATDARLSSLTTNIATIRGQLELYKLQHKGDYPEILKFTAQMTAGTKADGTPGIEFGPYLQRIPDNPFTVGGTGNDVTKTAADAAKAWWYDEDTGEFKANDDGTTNGVVHASL